MSNPINVHQTLQTITVHTHVDAQVYTAFSTFNNFTLNQRKLTLKLFPVLMIGLGVAHLANQYRAMGVVFIALGCLLPLSYLGFHRRALKNQIAQYRLEKPRLAYTITLMQSKIFIENGKEKIQYPYEMCYGAYQVPHFCYVYITKAKCFILPTKDLQDEVTKEELWAFLQDKLGAQRTKSYIKNSKKRQD